MPRQPYRRAYNENIVDAIQLSGWRIIYLSSIYDNPFKIRIYNETESHNLSIYGWGLTHGGGKRNPNEYRIQVQVDSFLVEPDFQTIVLGWWKDVEVFAGFDVRKHLGLLGDNDSIQVNRDALQTAAANGLATHLRQNEEIVIAFRPELFVDYARNVTKLHDFGASTKDIKQLESLIDQTAADSGFVVNDSDLGQVSGKRKSVTRTLIKKVRDSTFQRRVLNAYGSKCAFCNVQLKLIDAAHILPVDVEGSTDYTSNGIALCALHHRAYDNSFVTFNEKYETLISEYKVKHLRNIGHDGGMTQFLANLRPMIVLPPTTTDRPHTTYVTQANESRGWQHVKVIKV